VSFPPSRFRRASGSRSNTHALGSSSASSDKVPRFGAAISDHQTAGARIVLVGEIILPSVTGDTTVSRYGDGAPMRKSP